MRMLVHWILSAIAIWVVSRLVPGFIVSGPLSALIAALVIGFVNATLGLLLKIITFPLTILTLGIFWLIINAVVIELASAFVPGFHILTFASAFWGGLVLSLLNMLLKWLVVPSRREY
jgi:putative membrane protein